MKHLAVRRLRSVFLPKGEGLPTDQKIVILSELAKIGVRPTNPNALDKTSASFALYYREWIKELCALKGGDVDYVPLFTNFPEELLAQEDDYYFAKRVMGYVGNIFGIAEGKELDSGTVVPEWLFDLKDFGADPITQMQSKELFEAGKQKQKRRMADAVTSWLEINFVWEDEAPQEILSWVRSCLSVNSSLKKEVKTDLKEALEALPAKDFSRLSLKEIPFKENQAVVLQLLWEMKKYSEVEELCKSPTDVLRLFAALTESDVSLGEKIKFPKLRRVERRSVMKILEKSSALEEDLLRYKDLWLEIGRYLHPGEGKRKFPKTFKGFSNLRNGKIRTFNGKTESLLASGNLKDLLPHISKRPGIFAKKLHELLRKFPGSELTVLDAFSTVSDKVTFKSLLTLRSYFQSINNKTHRAVINKKGKISIIENTSFEKLSDGVVEATVRTIDWALVQSLGGRESWDGKDSWAGKKVWLDPAVNKITVPLSQRSASDGILSFGRGSRIPLTDSKVLRLFVYWKQTAMRTDLDLSLVRLDKDFGFVDHVSYTNLAAYGCVHSGDIRSAPHGAAEFIDVNMDYFSDEEGYLVPQIHKYCGENFSDMLCHAGWMGREKVDKAYKSFDIKTVENKFDLSGRGRYHLPMFVDLKNREIIFVDLCVGSANSIFSNVETSVSGSTSILQEIISFTDTKPLISDLAQLNLSVRGGEAVEDKEEADITIGCTSDCTINVGRPENVLSVLFP